MLSEGHQDESTLNARGANTYCSDGIHVDMNHLKKGEVK